MKADPLDNLQPELAQQRKYRKRIFNLNTLFPAHPRVKPRGPLPKQRLVFHLIDSGDARGGGIVWQGGYGCSKTVTGCAVDIWAHQKYPGLTSAIGRESYPAHLMSTWVEYDKMLDRVPRELIKSVQRPTTNTMGIIRWALGGETMFISLSDVTTWASTNMGVNWVDEGHLQQPKVVKRLADRNRQESEGVDYPRVQLITTNPGGHNYIWSMAHPRSPRRLANWFWIQSNIYENPALPADYIKRLEEKYPPGTAGHKRWCLGESTAVEGAAFGDIFFSDPEDLIHVVPPFPVPANWDTGRGIDWGINNPTVCEWGAMDGEGALWVYRTHTEQGKSATWQAEAINELEKEEWPRWVPADPSMWIKNIPKPGQSVIHESVAEQFHRAGCRITQANNDRASGMSLMLELLAQDSERIHPATLKPGAPRIFIMDTQGNRPLINCIETIQLREAAKTGQSDAVEDVKKKDDHWYDALRYLIMEIPQLRGIMQSDPIPAPRRRTRGSKHYRGY